MEILFWSQYIQFETIVLCLFWWAIFLVAFSYFYEYIRRIIQIFGPKKRDAYILARDNELLKKRHETENIHSDEEKTEDLPPPLTLEEIEEAENTKENSEEENNQANIENISTIDSHDEKEEKKEKEEQEIIETTEEIKENIKENEQKLDREKDDEITETQVQEIETKDNIEETNFTEEAKNQEWEDAASEENLEKPENQENVEQTNLEENIFNKNTETEIEKNNEETKNESETNTEIEVENLEETLISGESPEDDSETEEKIVAEEEKDEIEKVENQKDENENTDIKQDSEEKSENENINIDNKEGKTEEVKETEENNILNDEESLQETNNEEEIDIQDEVEKTQKETAENKENEDNMENIDSEDTEGEETKKSFDEIEKESDLEFSENTENNETDPANQEWDNIPENTSLSDTEEDALANEYRKNTSSTIKEIIETKPKNNFVEKLFELTNLAKTQYSLGHISEARAIIIEWLSLKKDHKELNLLLGKIYEDEKDFEKAEIIYKDIALIHTEDEEVLKRLANILIITKKLPIAYEIYKKILTLGGDLEDALYILAHLAAEIEDFSDVYQYTHQYLKQWPNNKDILSLLSEANLRLGKRKEAIETLLKLKNLSPYDAAEIDALIEKLRTEEEMANNFGSTENL